MLISGFISCSDNKQNKTEIKQVSENKDARNNTDKIVKNLCSNFPKKLVMKHNPDAKKLEIENIELVPGKTNHCKLKLYYGEKEYEFWEGQVSAVINQMQDPFWQYNPKRNASLYHKVEGLGDKAVFIANMCQLLILKKGILYSITPPNRGSKTSTGKSNKEIAIEVAKYYKL